MAIPSTLGVRQALARQWRARRLVVPLGVFLGTLLLYLTTLTDVHTFDALSYVTSVERKPWTEVFHPHHLAYGPLGAIALAAGRMLGYQGGAALPMQLINATAGALGVALFWRIVHRVTRRMDVALLAALLLAGAYAYWYYAVEVEVYTVATLFLLICLRFIVCFIDQPSHRGLALLGLAQGGAVLFHQTNLLFCAPVLVVLATLSHRIPNRRLSAAASSRWPSVAGSWSTYLLVLALTVGLPYLIVGVVVSGFRDWDAFIAWFTEYARTGWWGGPITSQKWVNFGAGISNTLAQPGGAQLWLLLSGLLVLQLASLWSRRRVLVGMVLAWLLVYGAFFLWWEPDNIEFWIASLPPALLLLALALRGERPWGPGVWIALAVAGTVLVSNYDAIRRRGDPATDLQRVIAGALARQSRRADVLLVPDGLLELYLPYYEGHDNFISLNQALFNYGGDWDRACAAVQTRIEAALHAGATTLIAEEVLHPPAVLLARHHLTQAQVDACLAPYRAALRPVPMPPQTARYWRLPTAQERVEGSGWHFMAAAEGWRATNMTRSRFEGGWRFAPGTDPALTSPLLNLDAGRYRAIIIRLATNTASREAQLFYAGPDGQIDERRSVRWTLAASDDVVEYTLDLRHAPGWLGIVTRLRIDPVAVGDGGEVRLESVRLVHAAGS